MLSYHYTAVKIFHMHKPYQQSTLPTSWFYISQCSTLYLTRNAGEKVQDAQSASLNTWFRELWFNSQLNRLPERYGSSVDLCSGVSCIRVINDVHPHLGSVLGSCTIDNGRGGDRSGTFGRFITSGRKFLIINKCFFFPSEHWGRIGFEICSLSWSRFEVLYYKHYYIMFTLVYTFEILK